MLRLTLFHDLGPCSERDLLQSPAPDHFRAISN